jgi:hypothetical protein
MYRFAHIHIQVLMAVNYLQAHYIAFRVFLAIKMMLKMVT